MKKVVFLTVALLLTATLAFGQAGSIGIFGDTQGTDCSLWDNAFGVCLYHVVYVNHGGATAVQYAAPAPACLGAPFLADMNAFPINLGGTQTGISTGFGGCFATPTLLTSMQFFCQMLTPPCCYYPVVPDPGIASGLIEAVDCAFSPVYPTGGVGIVNPNGSCMCDVPAQDTTWGQVKSLFAE